jgi:hypothetical protein
MHASREGYLAGMDMDTDRDELDSLAAEAGQSAGLIGITALMLLLVVLIGLALG